MKILVISSTVWNTDNSFGNTFSNLFEGLEDVEIANIYCNYGTPKNKIVRKYFQITEKTILQNLFNKKIKSGKVIDSNQAENLMEIESKGLSTIKQKRWSIFFLIRKFIWYIGHWRSKELDHFIKGFQPDIIFVPLYHPSYLNKVILYSQKITNAKLISYAMDDVYSLKRKSYSPLFWLDRLGNVRMSRKIIEKSNKLYSINEMQQREIQLDYGKESDILQKGILIDSPNINKISKKKGYPIKIVYTGNIYGGREESLSLVTKAIEELNISNKKVELYIYTGTILSEKVKNQIESPGNAYIMGSVSSDEIDEIQNNADILLHVEAINLRKRLEVRHSLSTKIVDYLSRGKCILAVGIDDVASIDYLKANNIALVAESKEQIKEYIINIYDHPNLLNDFGNKAIKFATENHNIEKIQKKLLKDLKNIIKE